MLMRFGLSDARNYDSVELETSLAWFDPIFEPRRRRRSSRRDVTWAVGDPRARPPARVVRRRDRRRDAASAGAFDRVEKAGRVWIAWLDAAAVGRGPIAGRGRRVEPAAGRGSHPRSRRRTPDRLIVRETWDPGWTAHVDGRPAAVEPGSGPFFADADPIRRS